MPLLAATNLYPVSSYGEPEFWFASIKVMAIILSIGVGALFLLGLWLSETPGFAKPYDRGGFAPNGALAVFAGITTRDLCVRWGGGGKP